MPIREAKLEDMMDLMALSSRFHDEDPFYTKKPFCAESTAETIVKAIKRESSKLFIYELDGDIVALLFAYLDRYPFSKSLQAVEEMLYVDKNVRGRGFGAKLIGTFVKWGVSQNADVYLNPRSQVDQKGLNRLLKAKGFKQHGINMVLERI